MILEKFHVYDFAIYYIFQDIIKIILMLFHAKNWAKSPVIKISWVDIAPSNRCLFKNVSDRTF